MGIIKKDDIIGYHLEQEVVCCECYTDDVKALTEDQILTEDPNNEDLIFCDRCKQQIA